MNETDNATICDVCQSEPGTHNFDILKESGGGAVHTCETCTQLGRKLGLVVKEAYCLWCWNPTKDKYEWLPYGQPGEPSHRICGECRKQIVFSNNRLTAEPLGELL